MASKIENQVVIIADGSGTMAFYLEHYLNYLSPILR